MKILTNVFIYAHGNIYVYILNVYSAPINFNDYIMFQRIFHYVSYYKMALLNNNIVTY